VHWESFDKEKEQQVKLAIRKIEERDKPLTPETLREELDMGPKTVS
jgi:hypothetical protein